MFDFEYILKNYDKVQGWEPKKNILINARPNETELINYLSDVPDNEETQTFNIIISTPIEGKKEIETGLKSMLHQANAIEKLIKQRGFSNIGDYNADLEKSGSNNLIRHNYIFLDSWGVKHILLDRALKEKFKSVLQKQHLGLHVIISDPLQTLPRGFRRYFDFV